MTSIWKRARTRATAWNYTTPTTPPSLTLGTLGLDNASAPAGSLVTFHITGATAGSTITGTVPVGMVLDGTARTISGVPSIGNYAFTLTETLAGAVGSPKASMVNYTITAVATLGTLTLDATSIPMGSPATVHIIGSNSGSTITGTVPDGMTLNSAARTITGTPTTQGSYTFTLTETLTGATGSPKGSSVTLSVTAAVMDLGMNLNGLMYYTGYYPFANVMWNAGFWERNSGSGTFTQDRGVLTCTDPTATFTATLSRDGGWANFPRGTYTVLNPEACNVGIGSGPTPDKTGYTTATQFTFTIDGTEPYCAIYIKSKDGISTNFLTGSSGQQLAVIMPGHLSSWQSGNYFNSQFLAFHQGSKPKVLRFMDWFDINKNIMTDISRFPTASSTLLGNTAAAFDPVVPIEVCADLCNRLSAEPWISIPSRASDQMVTDMCNRFKTYLNTGLKARIELANETWNTGFEACTWFRFLNHTSYTATPNSDGTWHKVGHGLTNSDRIIAFSQDITNAAVYPFAGGCYLKIEVVDANNFKTLGTDSPYPQINSNTAYASMLYKKETQAGDSNDIDGNYATRAMQVWALADAVFGRSQTVHVMASQLGGTGITSNRLAVSGVTTNMDVLAIAPYYNGEWFLGAVDVASGQLTPKAWTASFGPSVRNVRIGIYASGSNPSIPEVLAGTGTGFIGGQTLAVQYVAGVYTHNDPHNWYTGSAITGLTNGTTYKVCVVYTDMDGDHWFATGNATVSATTSTVAFNDGYDNMAVRARKNIAYECSLAAAHQALIPSKPIVAYEAGSDYYVDRSSLPEVVSYRAGYTQSTQAADVFKTFYRMGAAAGYKLMCQFADVSSDPGVFNIAESLTDTSDGRYVWFGSQNGAVPVPAALSVSDITASDIKVAPSYPATVATLPTGPSYTIIGGDDAGNYALVGNLLKIVNGTGINWSAPTARNVRIEATDGYTSKVITVSFATGDAWYPADATFAFRTSDDTNTAAVNPAVGPTVPLYTGTGATIAGDGSWDMDGNCYYLPGLGDSARLPNTALLLAAKIDLDNSTFPYIVQFGVGNNSSVLAGDDNTRLFFYYTGYGNPGGDVAFAGLKPTGKHVVWSFWDGVSTIYSGIDQTEYTTGRITGATPPSAGMLANYVSIGGQNGSAQCQAKIGSILQLPRSGMTLTDALAIVANM